MTPQLMQAIKLLQLSSLDLAAYVDAELERNPLLDRAPENEADVAGGAPEGAADAERSEDIRSGDWMGEDLETSRAAIEQRLDTDLENVFPADSAEPPVRPAGAELPPASGWAAVGSGGRDGGELQSRSLRDVGARRLPTTWPSSSRLPALDPAQRLIGAYLIDLVDEAGYVARRPRCGRREARRIARRRRRRARAYCRVSTRPASVPAISPNASRSS